jgi:hypothetical protein
MWCYDLMTQLWNTWHGTQLLLRICQWALTVYNERLVVSFISKVDVYTGSLESSLVARWLFPLLILVCSIEDEQALWYLKPKYFAYEVISSWCLCTFESPFLALIVVFIIWYWSYDLRRVSTITEGSFKLVDKAHDLKRVAYFKSWSDNWLLFAQVEEASEWTRDPRMSRKSRVLSIRRYWHNRETQT